MTQARPDPWMIGGHRLNSRLLLGSAGYPNPQTLAEAIQGAQTEVVTVGLKRSLSTESKAGDNGFVALALQAAKAQGARLLPNTAGCRTARESVQLACMARELYDTTWIKLEVIGDEHTLQPDPFELLLAATELVKKGFTVLPYCTDDLVLCRRLLDAGCEVLMPWGAPIGSGQGLLNPFALRSLRERLPDATLIVDAGLGAPSHATQALEMGFDAVLLNSAVAQARDPVGMATAFRDAVRAGRQGFLAGLMSSQDFAVPSTPVSGHAFLLGSAT
jgi:thiazole synthase